MASGTKARAAAADSRADRLHRPPRGSGPFAPRFRPLLALVVALAGPPAPARGEATDDGGIWTREGLAGDWGGLRGALGERGVIFTFNYIGEAFGNFRGGESRRAIYEGRLEMSLDLDLEKMLGWRGGTLHATGYQIHGRGLSAGAIGNLLTVSGIEARPGARLFTLWLEQALFGEKFSIRVGQIAADDEFAISAAAATFVNSTFGWPAILAANLPSGGPAYPLATPGVRLRVQPFESLSLQAAIFSGDPAGSGVEPDPQRRNPSGTKFSFAGGAFLIAEAAYRSGDGGWPFGLPASAKAGLWYHTGCFGDQRFDAAGLSLADPASTGQPRPHCGNLGGYAVLDQAIWRAPGSKERGLDVFVRVGANSSDRNLIGWYFDAGMTFRGPLAGRADDIVGIAFGLARIGSDARSLDRDAARFGGPARPVRDHEAVLELTYRAQIAPWWTVQPDLQLVFHPGGTVANPRSATGAVVRDAVVFGLRTAIKF